MSSLRTAARLAVVALLVAGCVRLSVSRGGASDTTAAPSAPTRTEQVSGTRALLIAVSPVSDDVAWVSGSLGTWVRTLDGGATWTTGRVPGADSLQFRDVHAVSADVAYLLSIGDGPQLAHLQDARRRRDVDGAVPERRSQGLLRLLRLLGPPIAA